MPRSRRMLTHLSPSILRFPNLCACIAGCDSLSWFIVSVLSFKYRIKDGSGHKHLARHAIACNQVWNFCVATTREAERRRDRWPSAYDLMALCKGASGELGILDDTVGVI